MQSSMLMAVIVFVLAVVVAVAAAVPHMGLRQDVHLPMNGLAVMSRSPMQEQPCLSLSLWGFIECWQEVASWEITLYIHIYIYIYIFDFFGGDPKPEQSRCVQQRTA